jgi:hypothetical protein
MPYQMLGTGSRAGGLPVWVTVLLGRLVGGFLIGRIFILADGGGYVPGQVSASSALTRLFVPTVVGALVTGAVIAFLLPRLSELTVGFGNAALAAFAGAMLPVIVNQVLAHSQAAGATSFVGLITLVGAVAITATMVSASTTPFGHASGGPGADSSEYPSLIGDPSTAADAPRGYWGALTDHPSTEHRSGDDQ